MTDESHRKDPTLSLFDVEMLLMTLENLRATARDPKWLPEDLDEVLRVMPRSAPSEPNSPVLRKCSDEQFKICVDMFSWIRIARRTLMPPEWIPGKVDLLKSRLFWRLRSGKLPLPFAPPTSFSYPWYELIEQADRAHWAYECYVHKDGWNGKPGPIASIGQCVYQIEEWTDSSQTIPKIVSFGPYRFKVFLGPYETTTFNSIAGTAQKTTITGWWIQCINPEAAIL